MESFVDREFYRNEYKGQFGGSDEDLEKLLWVAAVKVNQVCWGRVEAGWEGLGDRQKRNIKMACCFQADYFMNRNGWERVTSYSFPDVKVSMDGRFKARGEKMKMDETAWALLEETGLGRGVLK